MRAEAKRRGIFWFAFLLPWVLIWALPDARTLLGATIDETLIRGWGESIAPEAFADLVARFPDDMQAQVGAAKNASGMQMSDQVQETEDNTSVAYKLKSVMRRFPDAPLPCADFLRFSLSWMQDDRLAGDLENPYPPPYKNPSPERRLRYAAPGGPPGGMLFPGSSPATTPAPSTLVFEQPNFSRTQWKEAVVAARHDQQLEPNNAYFDWVLTCLLLSGYRDIEARRALHNGSMKPHFDDHTAESVSASIHAAELIRPLLIEDKTNLYFLERFSQLTPYRHTARLLTWQAWKMERAGQHKEAIALRADLARMGSLLLRDHNAIDNNEAGGTIEELAWRGNGRIAHSTNLNLAWPQDRELQVRVTAQRFALYARSHGYAPIARTTLQQAKENNDFYEFLKRRQDNPSVRYGIPLIIVYRIRAAAWLGWGLLVLWGVLATCCTGLSLWLFRADTERPEPTGRIWPIVLGCTALTTLSAAKALQWALQFDEFFHYWERSSSRFEEWYSNGSVMAFLLLPTLLPALYCLAPAWLKLHRNARQRQAAERAVRKASEPSHLPRDLRPFILPVIMWGSLISVLFGTLGWFRLLPLDLLSGINSNAFATIIGDFGIALLTLNLTVRTRATVIRWRFLLPHEERSIAHGAVRRYQATLGALLIGASWAYFIVLCLSLIPRQQAEAQYKTYLRQGYAVLRYPSPLLPTRR